MLPRRALLSLSLACSCTASPQDPKPAQPIAPTAPFTIGAGWFGGLLPATAFAISAQTGNIYAGLWYAVIVALVTVLVGATMVPGSTHRKSIFPDDPEHRVHR